VCVFIHLQFELRLAMAKGVTKHLGEQLQTIRSFSQNKDYFLAFNGTVTHNAMRYNKMLQAVYSY